MPDESKYASLKQTFPLNQEINPFFYVKDSVPFVKDPTKRKSVWSGQIGGTHYKSNGIQPAEFIHKNKLNWCEGNIVKYTCRHNKKNGKDDIEKVIHYALMLLEEEYDYTYEEAKELIDKLYGNKRSLKF